MARHKQEYQGERYSAKVTLQFTPEQRARLEQEAARAGASISQYSREKLMRRAGAAQIVAGTSRDPALRDAINQLTAVGVNLNQLARVANIHRESPQLDELKDTTGQLKAVFARLLAL